MAMVDFSNARIEVNPTNTFMPIDYQWLNMNNAILLNSQGSSIVTNQSRSIIEDNKKKITVRFSGTFTASGTEFYVCDYFDARWKVSGISFQSGDTYMFDIPATLICN